MRNKRPERQRKIPLDTHKVALFLWIKYFHSLSHFMPYHQTSISISLSSCPKERQKGEVEECCGTEGSKKNFSLF